MSDTTKTDSQSSSKKKWLLKINKAEAEELSTMFGKLTVEDMRLSMKQLLDVWSEAVSLSLWFVLMICYI